MRAIRYKVVLSVEKFETVSFRMYGSKQKTAKYWLSKRRAMPLASKAKRYKAAPARVSRPLGTSGARVGAPLPAVLKTNFRVSGMFDANPGAAGAMYTQTFKLNSLFDPCGTIGSDQPRGFDQLAALYESYRVKSIRLNCQTSNQSNTLTASGSYVVGFQFTESSVAPAGQRDAVEQGYCIWKLVGNGQDSGSDLTMSLDMTKFKGRSYKDDANSASTTADPADLVYAHFFIQAVNNLIDLPAIAFHFTLDQEAELFQPINVAAS